MILREVKVITTPSNLRVELQPWLTAGEMEPIEEIFFSEGVDSVDGNKLKGSALTKLRRAVLRGALVSIDGNTENVVEKAFELRKKDFDFIAAAAMELLADEQSDDGKKNGEEQ